MSSYLWSYKQKALQRKNRACRFSACFPKRTGSLAVLRCGAVFDAATQAQWRPLGGSGAEQAGPIAGHIDIESY